MQNLNVSMVPYTQAGSFMCSQYDVGRTLTVTLQDENGDYEIPTGATVKIQATKPSGLGFSSTCTWSGSVVTITTTDDMTDEYGRFPVELQVTSGDTVLASTNFYMKVEKSPHPEGTTDGSAEAVVSQITALVTRAETAADTATDNAIAAATTKINEVLDGLPEEVADLKSDLGDLADLETEDKSSIVAAINEANQNGGSSGSGLTQTEKNLILTLFSKAAYAEDDASTTYDELEQLWTGYSITWSGSGYSKSNRATSVKAGASFTSTVTANTGFTLDTVTVTMGGVAVQGTWSNGTVTIPSVTGDVVITVTTTQATVTSISAVYTQSGTVYDTDSLDSLKADLVVTATFTDSSTGVIADEDYTLSGTLTEETSTITVAYGGKTTTFNVTVTEAPLVPTGYAQVDYLESTQTSSSSGGYINSDVSFTNPTTAVFKAKFMPKQTSIASAQNIIGTRQTDTGATNNIGYNLYVKGDKTGIEVGSGSPGVNILYDNIYQTFEIESTWTASSVSISDGTTSNTNQQTTRGCTGYPICVFGLKKAANNQYTNLFDGRIYRAQAYENGTLILDLIPCTRDSDNAVGMYDRVNDAFITPSGTASCITAGNDV